MKISYQLSPGFIVGVALLSLCGAELKVAAQNNLPGAATVVGLHGTARFSNDNKSWQPLKKGALLNAGTMIQTAGNSTVDLNLEAKAGENRIRVQADSVLGIDRLAAPTAETGAVNHVELDLRAGQLAGHIGRLQPGSRYEVKFSSGIAGFRGGDFRMTASGMVAIENGTAVVVVVGADGTPTSRVVNAGKQFNAATGTFTEILKSSPDAKKPLAKPSPESFPANSPATGPGAGGPLRKF